MCTAFHTDPNSGSRSRHSTVVVAAPLTLGIIMRRAVFSAVVSGLGRHFSSVPMHKGTTYQHLPTSWTVLGGAGNLGQILVDFLVDAGASSIKVWSADCSDWE